MSVRSSSFSTRLLGLGTDSTDPGLTHYIWRKLNLFWTLWRHSHCQFKMIQTYIFVFSGSISRTTVTVMTVNSTQEHELNQTERWRKQSFDIEGLRFDSILGS